MSTTKQNASSQNKKMTSSFVSSKKQNKIQTKKTLRVGDVCELKITSLGQNNIGIDETSYPYSIFVPNASLSSVVKAKIVKVSNTSTQQKYAIAKLIQSVNNSSSVNLPAKPGDILDVTIKSFSSKGAGIVELQNNYKLIVPFANGTANVSSPRSGKEVKVVVTRVKSTYGFAKIIMPRLPSFAGLGAKTTTQAVGSLGLNGYVKKTLTVGSNLITTLPVNAKQYGNYILVKVDGIVLFVKKSAMSNLQDSKRKVKIKVTKVYQNFALGKIVQINPLFQVKKQVLVRNNLRQMIANGMHFGEKAVKCHARMKNYIWYKKQGQNKNRPLLKKGRHVINLLKTHRCLNKALNVLTKYALKGRTFLFIGTKKSATGLIARASYFTKNSFYVNTRWLGGMLTNWKTILKSISKIRPILKEKQQIVRDILEKRQSIKTRLIKKALLLRKKSKVILAKGRQLLQTYKSSSGYETNKVEILQKAQKLAVKRQELVLKGKELLKKRQKFIQKRIALRAETLLLKEKGSVILNKYDGLCKQLTIYTTKLRELKSLYLLTTELKNLKTLAQQNSKNVYSVSYGKFKDVSGQPGTDSAILSAMVPSPPKDILNRIVLTIKATNSIVNESGTNAKSTAGVSSNQANAKILILSKLLTKFSNLGSYIKTQIKNVQTTIQKIVAQCQNYAGELKNIQTALSSYISLNNELTTTLRDLRIKFISFLAIIRVVKRQIKVFLAQKKFIKFLPRLRYLPTPMTKISEIVQMLLKKVVDPKLKYPIEAIYEQKLMRSSSSKKLAAARKKKWQRLEKYFGGISNMTKLNKTSISKNVAVIIGQNEEMNAVRECQKLGIKMITIVDTNCNPTLSDHIIPANDDSRNSIQYILTKMLVRIRLAQKIRTRFQKILKSKA
jgi:ribosomal protein S2